MVAAVLQAAGLDMERPDRFASSWHDRVGRSGPSNEAQAGGSTSALPRAVCHRTDDTRPVAVVLRVVGRVEVTVHGASPAPFYAEQFRDPVRPPNPARFVFLDPPASVPVTDNSVTGAGGCHPCSGSARQYSCRAPETPFSSWAPASTNVSPESATSSRVVADT